MISLLTPFRSEADQANTSLFLAKVCMSYVSSSLDKLALMVTYVSGTASSNGTDLLFA